MKKLIMALSLVPLIVITTVFFCFFIEIAVDGVSINENNVFGGSVSMFFGLMIYILGCQLAQIYENGEPGF